MAISTNINLKNNQNWLLSYTDLFLLVLSFFIFRFSILKYDINLDNINPIPSQQVKEVKLPELSPLKTILVKRERGTIIEKRIPLESNSGDDISYKARSVLKSLQEQLDQESKMITIIVNSEGMNSALGIFNLISSIEANKGTRVNFAIDLNNKATCRNQKLKFNEACLLIN